MNRICNQLAKKRWLFWDRSANICRLIDCLATVLWSNGPYGDYCVNIPRTFSEKVTKCLRETGMIASSSTFRPHPGRVIRDLFRQLHDVWHGTEALVYNNHPREAAASSYLARFFGRIASGVTWFLRSTAVSMQLSHQCRRCMVWAVVPLNNRQ